MTSEIDENQKIQRISRLLEKGGTMLASHHECGAPLFRYQGKVLCPVCDADEGQEVQEKRKKEDRATGGEIRPAKEPQTAGRIQLEAIIKNSINSIARSLEGETDLHRAKEKMECIEIGLKILRLLES